MIKGKWTIFEIIKSIIFTGGHKLAEIQHKIKKLYIMGDVHEEQVNQLITLASGGVSADAECPETIQMILYPNLSKTIELVREKRQRENTTWINSNYTKTLLTFLEKAEEQAEYEMELRYLVLKLKCQETEFVAQLKEITPIEQWPDVFEILLADTKRPADPMERYHLDGIRELFTERSRHPYIGTFKSYEEHCVIGMPNRS